MTPLVALCLCLSVALGQDGYFIYNEQPWDQSDSNWDHWTGSSNTPLVWSWGNNLGGTDNTKNWAAVDTTGQVSSTKNAFKVTYPANRASAAAGKTVTPNVGAGGIGFYERWPTIASAKTVRLTYEVAFGDSTFDFVKGGKLPGLYGGTSSDWGRGCSGGDPGENCFSCRIMWRTSGAGEAYIYYDRTMTQDSDLYDIDKSYYNSDDGDSIGRGSWTFGQGSSNYHTVALTLTLNGFDSSGNPLDNGKLIVSINGAQKISYGKMKWRKNSSVKFSGVMFTTFFGGSSMDWAPTSAQVARFRNFKVEYWN